MSEEIAYWLRLHGLYIYAYSMQLLYLIFFHV